MPPLQFPQEATCIIPRVQTRRFLKSVNNGVPESVPFPVSKVLDNGRQVSAYNSYYDYDYATIAGSEGNNDCDSGVGSYNGSCASLNNCPRMKRFNSSVSLLTLDLTDEDGYSYLSFPNKHSEGEDDTVSFFENSKKKRSLKSFLGRVILLRWFRKFYPSSAGRIRLPKTLKSDLKSNGECNLKDNGFPLRRSKSVQSLDVAVDVDTWHSFSRQKLKSHLVNKSYWDDAYLYCA